MATASLQRLCDHVLVLRLHEAGGTLGDPYFASGLVEQKATNSVTLHGYTTSIPFKPSHRKAVFAALRAHGFVRVSWERKTVLARTIDRIT